MKSKRFYVHNSDIHNQIAPNEVVPILLKLYNPRSVVDVGCGIGTWLCVFDKNGISDYIGIDGNYVNKEQLQISVEKFIEADLSNQFKLKRKFDLVISLEVAEHLDEKYASTFIETLCNLGDTIVFSAAVPGQDGQLHLNEQWPAYWQNIFFEKGFELKDDIRRHIWDNSNVNWWYKQNMFIATKITSGVKVEESLILKTIHPEMHLEKMNILEDTINKYQSGKLGGIKLGLNIIINSFLRRLF